MTDIDEFLWETIYIIKQLCDHGCEQGLLGEYGRYELDGDFLYEIADTAVSSVFSDTRNYFQEETELELYVFFDPALDSFYETCRAYEMTMAIKPESNQYRRAMKNAVDYSLSFSDYSYASYLYTDTDGHGRCRLVLVFDYSFCSYHELPGSLLEIKEALKMLTTQMMDELSAANASAMEAAA